MRAVVAISICLALSCGHPRAAVIAGTSTLGAIGVGLPLANECTPDLPGDCDAMHYAPYLAIGALAGALLGVWIDYEIARGEEEKHAQPAVRVEPVRAPRELPHASDRDVDPELSPSTECIEGKRDELDRSCRFELATSLDDVCACPDGKCSDLTAPRCGEIAAWTLVLGFATSRIYADAEGSATEDAARRCRAGNGEPGNTKLDCGCDGATCGCVAAVVCSPPSAVP